MPAHHSLDYVELTVPDLAAAKAFYATAFGWTFVDSGPAYAGRQRAGRVVTRVVAGAARG